MKVLLYAKSQKLLKKSGIGRAYYHQQKALTHAKVEFTSNPKESYDVVHINSGSVSQIRSFKKKGYKVIVHGHSTIQDFRRSFAFYRFIAPFFNRYLQKIYQEADCIITPTHYSKFLIESMHVVNCPVYAVSNGIDLDNYAYDQDKVDKFRKFFNLSKDQKVVIGVGLLFERKGIHDFCEVARMMKDVTFIWFGHLPKIMMTHFIKKALKGKPSNVILPGYIDGEIIKGAFMGSNAFLFPSYEETEGIVVLEALASKLPIVLRDIPVYYNWLEDGKHVYKGHNNHDFVKLLYKAFERDEELINKGYDVVKMRTLDKIGLQLKEIYQELINNKNQG